MKKIIKIAPIVSCLLGICLLFGILATFYGNVIYDLFAFHSKPFYCGTILVVHLCMEVRKRQYGLYGFT